MEECLCVHGRIFGEAPAAERIRRAEKPLAERQLRMACQPLAAARRRALAAMLALTCSACATNPVPPVPPVPPVRPSPAPTLYERLGGMSAITAMVDGAVRNIAADPRINRRFAGGDHGALATSLGDLLCERSGGPCVYRGRDMSTAHEGMQIRDDEFDALVDDIARSLDTMRVPPPEKSELLAIAERMRNAIVGH
jgi:hemoglobin